MIIDNALSMAKAVAVTTTGIQIGDIIDLKKPGNGLSNNPRWRVRCAEGVTSAGAANVTFDLETSDSEAFTTPVKLLTVTKAKADLGLNVMAVDMRLPEGIKQYMRTFVTPSATLTAGKFDSHIGY